jgi:hypothetical protein
VYGNRATSKEAWAIEPVDQESRLHAKKLVRLRHDSIEAKAYASKRAREAGYGALDVRPDLAHRRALPAAAALAFAR